VNGSNLPFARNVLSRCGVKKGRAQRMIAGRSPGAFGQLPNLVTTNALMEYRMLLCKLLTEWVLANAKLH
jgi:hypothetical protein